ncbi:MAG: hypothetical protein CYPHOPRED_004486 [Cyphobasidiales sp. Tagirdzhanova-0007]|nr:MAG: hypothetical protein CYPHOPRED_004486 [Cyphobasidiales sp. Tagirdzhanova-0007]
MDPSAFSTPRHRKRSRPPLTSSSSPAGENWPELAGPSATSASSSSSALRASPVSESIPFSIPRPVSLSASTTSNGNAVASQLQRQSQIAPRYTAIGRKRRAVLSEDDVDDARASDRAVRNSVHKPPPPLFQPCKFAKAGCPFVGSLAEVDAHERTYCQPLYTQLAHLKTERNQLSTTSTACPHPHLEPTPSKHSPGPETSELGLLRTQVSHLKSDLQRLQAELASEKQHRTEKLRRASERCMELMSLSEKGEERVEVLKMQVKAERELRERTEEELESVGRALAECDRDRNTGRT